MRRVEMDIALGDMDDSLDARASCHFDRDSDPDGELRGPGPCTITVGGGRGDDLLGGGKRFACTWELVGVA